MTSDNQKNSRHPSSDGDYLMPFKIGMIPSSKDNPCPVCDRTKDRDCSQTQDGGLVLCYTEGKDGRPSQTRNGYHFNGQFSGSYHGSNTNAQYTKKKPPRDHGFSQTSQPAKSPKEKSRSVQLAAAHVEGVLQA